jgi:AmmeMemoRadiSam system protein B
VAGSWYPADPAALAAEVDRYLTAATEPPAGRTMALIAPHAGLMYSGPVAAYAYRALQTGRFDAIVLVGPSHYMGFDGLSLSDAGAFATPSGPLSIAGDLARRIAAASDVVRVLPEAHTREHSLEMQLPFLARLAPRTPIVPLLMGYQTSDTVHACARALAAALESTSTLIVASTDLSHFFPADRAVVLDARTCGHIERLDPEGLLAEMEQYPEYERGRYVACGGGPAVSVMLAAKTLGARDARVLHYAHSGDVSGEMSAVVGYVAAAIGHFDAE